MKTPLYTIGHGNRPAATLLELLHTYRIDHLIDVRSVPYSRFHPQFRQEQLKAFLEANGVRYVYMGDQLGGRPKDESCYTAEGKIDYRIVRTKSFFKQGIARLRTAYEKDLRVAIMCSERDPAQCHRTRLIAEALVPEGVNVIHIDAQGALQEHEAVMQHIRMEKGLFG